MFTVDELIPDASTTRAWPPRPNASTIAPAATRFCFSFRCGNNVEKNPANASDETTRSTPRTLYLASYPVADPKVSNGPTESINNLITRIKRIGFGFRRFANYRIRVLLYAGTPNWDLLDTVTPR
ncbi:MAG: hypothetical protein EKK62_00135 [Acidimicrobiia bacterium]|nr:MAG: hypothetical protein EKK62_00135 [Acidimicrobiia bacterium]